MIRLATHSEAIEILNEPQNQNSIGLKTESLIYQPFIVERDQSKMMFVFWMVGNDCEAHIACKKDSILQARNMCKELIDWLFSLGVKRIITNCPRGIISNMAKKVGMKEYKQDKNLIYYEVLSWV